MIPRVVGSAIRKFGQGLDVLGQQFEFKPCVEKLAPSTRVVKFGGNVPSINNTFVASTGTVVGKVSIGSNSFVGYGAVIRGDGVGITIGDNVHVGDRVMVHVNGQKDSTPTIIGNNVTINAGAIVHGSTIEDYAVIGEGAQVMDGAVVKKNAFVAPGSIVTSGKVVPAGQLWSGVPAKYERDVSPAELEKFALIVEENVKLSELHAKETAFTWQEIEQNEYDFNQVFLRNDYYYKRLTPEQMYEADGAVGGHMVPGRIFNSAVTARDKPLRTAGLQ